MMMMTMTVGKYMIVMLLVCAELFQSAFGECTLPGSPFEFYKPSGTIQSNGYPDRYYGNEECDWTMHPPTGTFPELFVLRLDTIDTNIDDMPATDRYCENAKNYITVNGERACGQAKSFCISYILQTSTSSLDCHNTLRTYYPDCLDLTISQNQWPMKLSFRTSQPDNKAGFKLNYTFVDCGASPFPFPFPLPDNQATGIPSTTDALFDNETTSEPTTGKTNEVTPTKKSTTRRTTTTTSTRPFTSKVDRTSTPGKVHSTDTTTTKTVKEGVTSAVLTAMLVVMCVVLFVIILAIVFRKRLYVWIKREKKPTQMNGSVEKGGETQYTDAYLVPIGENPTSERPLPGVPPPVPPPYRSVSSVNSDTHLINEESNSLQYDRLNNGHIDGIANSAVNSEDCTYTSITT